MPGGAGFFEAVRPSADQSRCAAKAGQRTAFPITPEEAICFRGSEKGKGINIINGYRDADGGRLFGRGAAPAYCGEAP